MIGICIVSLLTLSDAASVLFKDTPLYVQSCVEGELVQNECNLCICSRNHVYECTPKSLKECNQGISPSLCHPSKIYVLDDTICICNRSGHWPHEQCNKIFKSFGSPTIKAEKTCKPNSYVANDCNVCRCGPNGKIDKDHCTKNKCDNTEAKFSKTRRLSKQSNVYGNCEIKNWYSLAPCQFCFCVNENKLVCNTGNSYAHKLELGAYNLSVCGKGLIREAIELIPENQKSLRYGIEKENATEETTTLITTTKKIQLGESNLSINVNREGSELKDQTTPKNNQNDNYEYYTDSEEEKPEIKATDKESNASTQQPYNEESPNDIEGDKKESEQEQETDNEMGVEIEAPAPKSKSVVKEVETKLLEDNSQQPTNSNKIIDNFNLGNALKLNLPMVLDKVFQMALRKSTVTLDSDSKCTPGAATILKCNVCFCMKENKLLCTNNVCE